MVQRRWKQKIATPTQKTVSHRLKAQTQRILITNVPFIITRGKDLRWITQKGSLRLFRSLRPARCSRSIDSARGVFYPASCQPRSASVARQKFMGASQWRCTADGAGAVSRARNSTAAFIHPHMPLARQLGGLPWRRPTLRVSAAHQLCSQQPHRSISGRIRCYDIAHIRIGGSLIHHSSKSSSAVLGHHRLFLVPGSVVQKNVWKAMQT